MCTFSGIGYDRPSLVPLWSRLAVIPLQTVWRMGSKSWITNVYVYEKPNQN